MKFWTGCIAVMLILGSVLVAEAQEIAIPTKQAAIVIDDFGNNMFGTKEMMNLPFPITVAVMPFLPTTKRDAEWAHQAGHEVIVHMPMEPSQGTKTNGLDPGRLRPTSPKRKSGGVLTPRLMMFPMLSASIITWVQK